VGASLGRGPAPEPGPDLAWAWSEAARGAPRRALALGIRLDPALLALFGG
jgi:hypothetical protein